jgi:radical SAM protein with 4Fe4S-binding SPASM domain
LHGGEPFLTPLPVLYKFTEPFIEMGVSIGATTNLVYKVTDQHLDFFKNVCTGGLATSWDNGIRFENEKQYNLWLNNLATLKAEKLKIKLFVSITKGVVGMDPADFLEELSSFNVSDVSLERLTVDGNAEINTAIFPSNEDQDNWFLKLYKVYEAKKDCLDFTISTLDTIALKVKNNLVKVDTSCRNCEQNLVTIGADGKLSGCPNGALKDDFGSISEPVVNFVYNEGRVTRISEELNFPNHCLRCDVFDICGGDCHRLPFKDGRCGGLKNLLRHLKYGDRGIPIKNLG